MTTAPALERIAEVSRRLRARADGVVAELWFMPESQTGYPTLGISGAAGTFGGRTGPLGALPGAAAAALLVPLNPAFTAPAVDEAWAATTPDELLALRERTATGYLAEIVGAEPDGHRAARPSSPGARPTPVRSRAIHWPPRTAHAGGPTIRSSMCGARVNASVSGGTSRTATRGPRRDSTGARSACSPTCGGDR